MLIAGRTEEHVMRLYRSVHYLHLPAQHDNGDVMSVDMWRVPIAGQNAGKMQNQLR